MINSKAKGTWVDDIFFSSKKEARYYGELKIKQKAGLIKEFSCHPAFDITVNGVHICKHVLDFAIYHNDGTTEYVDVKSEYTAKDPINRLKKALLLAVHGINVTIKC
jgi:hypothetical protein